MPKRTKGKHDKGYFRMVWHQFRAYSDNFTCRWQCLPKMKDPGDKPAVARQTSDNKTNKAPLTPVPFLITVQLAMPCGGAGVAGAKIAR